MILKKVKIYNYRQLQKVELDLQNSLTVLAYLAKSTVGNAKNIFKISKIEGILTAYKLFYVGCSRARKNLVIVVDETKINKFENEFKAKLISIGFEIQGFPMQETATV